MTQKTGWQKGLSDSEAFVLGIVLIVIGIFFVIGSGVIGLIVMLCGLGLMTPKALVNWREIKKKRRWRK